jgi:hypothetical protein
MIIKKNLILKIEDKGDGLRFFRPVIGAFFLPIMPLHPKQ